jgi:hypothetical protein
LIGYDCQGVADNSVVLGDGNVTAVYMADDSGATVYAAGFKASQTAASIGVWIDHDANENALFIDHDGATSAECIKIAGPTQTTGEIISLSACDALTTGAAIQVDCGSANLATTATGGLVEILHDANSTSNVNNLLFIRNDHASSSGTKCLYIDQNADTHAIFIDAENVDSIAFDMQCDVLEDAGIARFYSNADDASTRYLVNIHNDHPSSDSAICLQINQDSNARAIELNSTEAAYTAVQVFANATNRSSSNAFNFYQSYTDGDNDTQHILRGDGEAYADASWNASGADYAEYFESKDGNKMAVGTTVKLDGDKVVACESGDTPVGVIRPQGCSSNIGNNAWSKWQGKYLTDDYGAYVMEEYTVTEWMEDTDEVKKSRSTL